MFIDVLLIVLAIGASFAAGASFGRSQEQIFVARTLVGIGQIDAATKTFINRFLGFAKAEYGMIYDEIVREFEKVKKAA